MRLSFPQAEHKDVVVHTGEIRIGSDSDNDVVLVASSIAPRHARLLIDRRGYLLFVERDARVHVNGRPVKEFALLRLGDLVSIDSVNMQVKPDADASIRAPADHTLVANNQAERPPKVALRAVQGPLFGRAIPIRNKLTVGKADGCDLVLDDPAVGAHHATIEYLDNAVLLRGSADTQVNGVPVRDAVLHPGDQIAFDRNRFLLEAPGLPVRPVESAQVAQVAHSGPNVQVTQTMRAIRLEPAAPAAPAAPPIPVPLPSADHAPELAASPTNEPAPAGEAEEEGQGPWRLIAAAILIALGIALLLLGGIPGVSR